MENLTYAARKLDICQICGNRFNVGERLPRILVNCGHTFCTRCLASIHKSGKVRCTVCNKLMKNLETIERLPLNIDILHELVESDPILATITFAENEEDEDKLCELHQERIKHFFCSNHRTIFCRECITVDHTEEACFVVDLYEIQKMKQIHKQNIINNRTQAQRCVEKNKEPAEDAKAIH